MCQLDRTFEPVKLRNDLNKYGVNLKMSWNCISRIAATAMVVLVTVLANGCDMGTYENRSNQSPPAETADDS